MYMGLDSQRGVNASNSNDELQYTSSAVLLVIRTVGYRGLRNPIGPPTIHLCLCFDIRILPGGCFLIKVLGRGFPLDGW